MRKCRIWLVNELELTYDENTENSEDILSKITRSLEQTPGVSEVHPLDAQLIS